MVCTVTPLLKIMNTRDFVGHVMPIDTRYVAGEKQQHRQRPLLCAPDTCAWIAKQVRNVSTSTWPICTK